MLIRGPEIRINSSGGIPSGVSICGFLLEIPYFIPTNSKNNK
jgi:hypothetical protein